MKIPKHFMIWFRRWGICGEYGSNGRTCEKIERIAWRAYRKGVTDTKNKYFNPWRKK